MKKFLLLTLFLSSCSTMNSDFSCDTTAGDSCLTIEEVDALTSFVEPPKARMWQPKANSKLKAKCTKCKTIYLPPWVDNSGIKHPGKHVKETA